MSIVYINPFQFAATGPPDPTFADVSLLLHGDGTNGSTTIVDSSLSRKRVTPVGNAQIRTIVTDAVGHAGADAFGRTDVGMILLDGTGDYLTIPSDASLVFGADDFTIEMWIWATSSSIGGIVDLGSNYGGIGIYQSLEDGCVVRINGVDALKRYFFAPSLWTHLAATRASSTLRLFYNGAQQGASVSNSHTISNGLGLAVVGAFVNAGTYYPTPRVYIDDLRITKGVARYTSDFTPPTAPFPDI